MLADWGIHHLHLSDGVEPNGFVKRGNELLFAVFGRDDAYLVGIHAHRDWLHEDLVPIIVRNWAEVGPVPEAQLCPGATRTVGGEARRRNRRLGVCGGFVEVDRDWYGTLGNRRRHAARARAPGHGAREELRLLRADPAGRLAQLAAALDVKAGRPAKGEWSPHVEDDIVGLLRGGDSLVQLGVLPGES